MEQSVEKQFSKELLLDAARRFGLKEDSLKELGKFENYVYEGEKEGVSYILRLVHSSHRNKNMVLGELDWIKYLADHGVKVARPLFSINNKMVEIIPVEGDYFSVSLFEKAPGRLLDHKNEKEWDEDIFRNWGKTLGMIHRITKEYQVPNEELRRPQWDEDDLLDLEKYLPQDQSHIFEIKKELMEYLDNLPKTKDSYGLIHTDVHSHNFFVHEGEITVFDFDDASYQWFISDIVIALYYSIWQWEEKKSHEEKKAFAEMLLKALLEGYREENHLEEFWLEQIPYFLRLRDITIYSVFHKKYDLSNPSQSLSKLLKRLKDRIEKKITILD